MRATAKYAVIYRYKEKYPVLVMCRFFTVSRSGYYSFVQRMGRPKKDAALGEMIRQQQEKCFHTYGYRRMWQWLKGSKGIYHNPKTILRVMREYGLLAEIRRRRRLQRMGEQLRDNPKFCVTAKSGANREKFIMGGRRVKRLPPC